MMKRHATLLLILCAIMQVGCTKAEKKETFKQGDLQTWKVSDGLIFKGYLGERRKHIPDEFDAQFYFPNSEKFIGQFPIDYTPEKFDKVSHEEAKQIFNDNLSYPLEFYLMLNGSWVEPTDKSIYAPTALDHEDQVKIQIHYAGKESLKNNTKVSFEYQLSNSLDKNSKQTYEFSGMNCFNFSNYTKSCFGKSNNIHISGYNALIDNDGNKIWVEYNNEFYYGGINIKYIADKKNLNQLPQIDQAIWRLLDTWNIVPN